MKVAGMYFDYLQAFPIDPEVRRENRDAQRRLQVREDVYHLRRIAARYRCGVWVAIQAKQRLDGTLGRNMLLPGIYDGEESSAIAQRLDRIVSMWMPKQTHQVGEYVEHNGQGFEVTENLLFLKVCKQRGGLPSGRVYKMYVDFLRNMIAPPVRDVHASDSQEHVYLGGNWHD